ncbi:MAG: transcriptional initiation protein Tat [Phycisphaerae bacterium]|nr:transcriptional initiation protein Tat [Phycisphaerae bacterium]NIP52586.1 transcriptional initiation protein Tat [Phycisphaerae bacterium]NIS51570.1 transcriptional initiation protein Tat [Phycisphaerae bacterium]NIU09152.1 transcriptional initiation protein Tat [Phycisphaerae bacterium]NIU59652.1 transcriptional initiation protein Tat [Phycisphaerae bacterium]
MFKYPLISAGLLLCFASIGCSEIIEVVRQPNTKETNSFYIGNRQPLTPSPFVKLPIGAIKPQGWVKKQLELEAEGYTGHLLEISRFLKKEDNAWLSPEGEGHSPWEEVPYWLKGYSNLGYVLADKRIIDEAQKWIEATIASQREDGYFGPRSNLKRIGGNKPDVWPNMIMLNVLQSYYEYSGDERVIQLMTKYFRWQLTIPDEDFLEPFWQNQRASDNLASVYWLYNRTGDKFLLELGRKIHDNTADWTGGVASWHVVNIAQCFRGPAVFYQQSKDPKHLNATEKDYQTVMGIYGQVPGGMFGADENARPGYIGPRQAAETCAMVEMMLSDEMLLTFTGDPKWADRCEEVTFNSLPASMTPDMKALHYLTAPNMILCDRHNKSPGLQNGGPMLLFNPHIHRCCQHNAGHGWPYYAQHLWLATPDNGLAAVLYASSQVTAKVGKGTEVTISESTHYPFDEEIELTVKTEKPVRFPLYLRVPGWTRNPLVEVNGKKTKIKAHPRSYIMIERKWKNGDKVKLNFKMSISIKKWEKNKDSVSVNRGPLTYSLKIGEKYVRQGGTDKWPAWEIHPTTPWNYGLIVNQKTPALSFDIVQKDWPDDDRPFEADAAPIQLHAKAKKIPEWIKDHLGLVGKIQQSPVKSDEPVETVTLIPMGCARLRISAFPTIGTGPDAHKWNQPPKTLPASASHCWGSDTVLALSDKSLPKSSNDQSIPRFTWWPRKGTTEWVQYNFNKPHEISSTDVYFFDDTGGGGCRVPKSWKLLYKHGDQWKQVPNAGSYGVEKDKFNKVSFDQINTQSLRIEVQLQPDFSAGILEWRTDAKEL